MASIQKHKKGWRAFVVKQNPQGTKVRKSAVFATKAEASAWAVDIERAIASGTVTSSTKITLSELLDKYSREVSSKKAGAQWEIKRIELFKRMPLAQMRIDRITPTEIEQWRDTRLETIQPESCRREWTILNSCFNLAVSKWDMLATNPMDKAERPERGEPRDRRITDEELETMCYGLGFDWSEPDTIRARVGAAFVFAIETAMRSGEITKLEWSMIDDKVARLPAAITKTRKKRDVPLSSRAREVLALLKPLKFKSSACFGITSDQITTHFNRVKHKVALEDLQFRDSRAEALSRLAKKFDALDLAKISGHRDLRILLNVYYRPTAEDLAAKLD